VRRNRSYQILFFVFLVLFSISLIAGENPRRRTERSKRRGIRAGGPQFDPSAQQSRRSLRQTNNCGS